jgi:hypothetical protein
MGGISRRLSVQAGPGKNTRNYLKNKVKGIKGQNTCLASLKP